MGEAGIAAHGSIRPVGSGANSTWPGLPPIPHSSRSAHEQSTAGAAAAYAFTGEIIRAFGMKLPFFGKGTTAAGPAKRSSSARSSGRDADAGRAARSGSAAQAADAKRARQ